MSAKLEETALLHEIFILDANLVAPLNNKKYKSDTKTMIQALMKVLNMKPLGKLEIYLATDKTAPGWSFIQPITTSHISGHYFLKPGKHPHIHVDIYSCKKFSYKKVVSVINQHLKLGPWSGNFVIRSTNYANRKVAGMKGAGSTILHEYSLA